jgi:hypothetical protein
MQYLKDGKYPTITVEIQSRVLKGTIRYGAWNAIAVQLTDPVPGGCVRWKIYEPREGEWLVDETGQFTEYGRSFMSDLLISLYDATVRMRKRLGDIKKAMAVVAADEGAMAAAEESYAAKVFEALPGPELEVDLPTFCSTYEKWMSIGLLDSTSTFETADDVKSEP